MEYLFKPQIIKTFTQQVKNFLEGSQLQVFRSWKTEEGSWVYELKLFPGPKKGYLLGWHPERREWALASLEAADDSAYAKQGLEVAQDPVQLFVRAHALNRRVEAVLWHERGVGDAHGSGWELILQSGVRLVWERETAQGARVKLTVKREGEKDFSRSFELGSLRAGQKSLSEDAAGAEPEVAPRPDERPSKATRLVVKVQGDVAASRRGLDLLQSLCSFLEGDPQAWGSDEVWTEEAREALRWVRTEARLPGFQLASRGEALETIYDLRRRYRRKLAGAQKRLIEVSTKLEEEPETLSKTVERQRAPLTKPEPKRTTGQWVEHPSGLRAKLGRNSRENAQLYREAGSRDLWFHIRGLGGSHVWVPRGQPLFGAKDAGLRDDLELWACQLAVFNSKARHSGTGVVDITEKRHLKSAKGQEGTLLIGRSETRMADIDEAFEKWLKT